MLIALLIWVLTIFSNGTSIISLNTTYTGSFMTLALPTQPFSAPLVYVNNTPVLPLLNGTSLIVPVFGHASVYVAYVPRVSVVNGLITIDIVNNETLEMVIPYKYVLIYNITLSLINFTSIDDQLIVTARGPGAITYTLAPSKPVVTTSPHTTPTMELLITVVVIAAVIISVVYFVIGRRRSRLAGSVALSDYELAVVNYLRSVGGEAYEVDISRQLNLPRTTVWRIIRRLESVGIVEVRKVHGKNLVILREMGF